MRWRATRSRSIKFGGLATSKTLRARLNILEDEDDDGYDEELNCIRRDPLVRRMGSQEVEKMLLRSLVRGGREKMDF